MRLIMLFAALALLAGCKTNKNLNSEKAVVVDSLATSAHHRSMAVIDSLVSNIDFSFDTLKINIERPVQYAETPEVIRLAAVRGRVVARQSAERNAVAAYNRLDTIAYKQSAVEATTEHSATTRIYNPPSANLLGAVALTLAAVMLYMLIRRKQ